LITNAYRTEIIYGTPKIIKRTLKRFSVTREKIDVCISSSAPEATVKAEPIFKEVLRLKKIGIGIRYITDVTQQNLTYCKDLMLTGELRHMDGIKGNFSIVDGRDYQATAAVKEGDQPHESVLSTARAFFDQQQYFFDMLWKKAIPAEQRIKEIEEDLKREFIETIQDSEETLSLVSKVLSSATEEILIVFSQINTLNQYEKNGILDLLKRKGEHEIVVRMLIGTNYRLKEKTRELLKGYPHIELRYLLKSIQTKLTTIVADGELSLMIEEKDSEDAIGLATYSNSESTVLSITSIFENLWMQSTVD
jgi:two-component system sensor histidine kinase VicK